MQKQCCQLQAKCFGQNNKKSDAGKKKILRHAHKLLIKDEAYIIVFFYKIPTKITKKVRGFICKKFWLLQYVSNTLQKVRPGKSYENSDTDFWAASIFIRQLSCPEAKMSASWQYWPNQCKLGANRALKYNTALFSNIFLKLCTKFVRCSLSLNTIFKM
jgi:hypothetical protein